MKHHKAKPLFPSHSGLCESPLYETSSDMLFFVDINNHSVHSVPLSLGWEGKRSYAFLEPITYLNLVKSPVDLLAVQKKA